MTSSAVVRKRRTTIRDVADAAGVSPTTVSFVVNRTAGTSISEETKTRVLAAAQELNYRPNAAASVLKTNRSHSIGFVTDSIASNPSTGDIIRGAQNTAWGFKQLLTIINTDNDSTVEDAGVQMLLERRVDGIIYASISHKHVDPPQSLREVPTVLLNCFSRTLPLSNVVPDEVGGGQLATEILLAAGHRRIGFLNMDLDPEHPPAKGRLIGYRQALAKYGVSFDSAIVRSGDSFAADGYQLTLELITSPNRPTALYCGTDRMAMGAYDALRDLGLRVPDDVSIVGFDDQHLISSYLRPALSTVALPYFEMGCLAVELLQSQLPDVSPRDAAHLIASCRYVERASVKFHAAHLPVSNREVFTRGP